MFQEPLAVNHGQTMTGSMRFSANSDNSYDTTVTLEVNGVSRTLETTLMDSDATKRNLAMTEQKVGADLKVQVVDWSGTTAASKGRQVVVNDPFKEAKIKSNAEAAKPKRKPTDTFSRPVGSQITVNGKEFTLLDEPTLTSTLSKEPLMFMGAAGDCHLMSPLSRSSIILEFRKADNDNIATNLWMEESAGRKLMEESVLRSRQSPLSREQVEKLDSTSLISLYRQYGKKG